MPDAAPGATLWFNNRDTLAAPAHPSSGAAEHPVQALLLTTARQRMPLVVPDWTASPVTVSRSVHVENVAMG